jgi:hypothetical protein
MDIHPGSVVFSDHSSILHQLCNKADHHAIAYVVGLFYHCCFALHLCHSVATLLYTIVLLLLFCFTPLFDCCFFASHLCTPLFYCCCSVLHLCFTVAVLFLHLRLLLLFCFTPLFYCCCFVLLLLLCFTPLFYFTKEKV